MCLPPTSSNNRLGNNTGIHITTLEVLSSTPQTAKMLAEPLKAATATDNRFQGAYTVDLVDLQTKAVYLETMGWYLCLAHNVAAARALAAREFQEATATTINAPESARVVDPVAVLSDQVGGMESAYRELRSYLLDASGGFASSIRGVGGKTKEWYWDLVVSVEDAYMLPAKNGSCARATEHIPERVALTNLTNGWSWELTLERFMNSKNQTIILDPDLVNCMTGEFRKLAVSLNTDAYAAYVHECRARRVYADLENKVSMKNGDPNLLSRIEELNKSISGRDSKIESLDKKLAAEQEQNKELAKQLAAREATIKTLMDGKSHRLAAENVEQEIENQNLKMKVEREKIHAERAANETRQKEQKITAGTNVMKTVAEIVKALGVILASGLGIWTLWMKFSAA